MGLFGGSKSSTTNLTKTNNVGFSEISGNAAFTNIEGNNNSVTDYGAIDRALQVAEKSLGAVEQSGQSAVAAASLQASKAVDAVSAAAKQSTQSILENLMIWGVVGLIGYVALKGR